MKKKTVEKSTLKKTIGKTLPSNKVKGSWLVISRDLSMQGGLFNYGVANINEFFDTEKKAVSYAEKLIKSDIAGEKINPMVWVLRCERTYQKCAGKPAYAYSEYGNKK